MNAAAEDRTLHTTQPHGSQDVLLHEDDTKPANRIFVIQNEDGRWVPILGSEIESLCSWWGEEQEREGVYEEPGQKNSRLPASNGPEINRPEKAQEIALEHLQFAIDKLGPLTENAPYVQRETLLELIDEIESLGRELKRAEIDSPGSPSDQ